MRRQSRKSRKVPTKKAFLEKKSGTNKYPNKDDRMKQDLELFPFVKVKPRKTLITPIIEKNEKVEQERLDLEQYRIVIRQYNV
jgi:hypothetical protein